LIAVAVRCSPEIRVFSRFIEGHSWLLDKRCLEAFYSRGLLRSDPARAVGIFPDLRPLP
jgi:hypothetical protein